ncbi:NADP dehydrogenase [ubiquinone] 1 alpha subcomplex subunit 11 [Plakobranchus ocellatus]|uniref:NADH dehydrogenase [ubiquinone] 1 alpha subcomplex subunit 11 n=1 Tax=Plakobranchus ocellatus TaxID=259542 RepID=A0AAV3ZX79_9GAST|nr:NADP dehydrogenase [ubiquinone] 1 alpha subcomplex subunit 11 [Plakobranchus ocellatus]
MGESRVRYSTDIPTEYYYKYREKRETKPGDFYYGKDSDMLYKTWIAMKRGAALGVMTGLTMSIHPPPYSIGYGLQNGFKFGMPPLIAATTYSVTMSLATNIRKKEDAWNHAIGGYAAGTMMGVWFKNQRVGVFCGLVAAMVASSFKKMAEFGILDTPLTIRRERVFDFYRTGWMIERPPQEGIDDGDKNDAVKHYSP